MNCPKCGAPLRAQDQFCPYCGAKAEQTDELNGGVQLNGAVPIPGGFGGRQSAGEASPQIPEEYRPLSMWAYLGYQILFSIPCVGFICLIVFSFGGTRNINLRNFARSYLCFMVVLMIMMFLMGGFSLLAGAPGLVG